MSFTLHPILARDTFTLGYLSVCQVLLMNDAQFPWIILVPQRDNITEFYQLNEKDLDIVNSESLMISKLLMHHFKGDKLNVAALGNLVPQLHLHHIVRFTTDPAWPQPVWGKRPPIPYTTAQMQTLRQTLQPLIQQHDPAFMPC